MFEAYRNNKLAREFSVKHSNEAEVFHSSSFGQVQSGENIGTAAVAMTMDNRKSIEEQRKYVRKYNNSKIVNSTYGLRHAETYTPRTEGGARSLYGGTKTENGARTGMSQTSRQAAMRESAARNPRTFLRNPTIKK
jgi:hypothetical protein